MNDVEELAAKVRNHPESAYTGEHSQEEVIREALEQELAHLDSQAELQQAAEAKQSELQEKFGLSGKAPTDEGETATDADLKQAELRNKILDNQ